MVLEKVRALLAKQLEIDPGMIGPETDIMDDLGADSLDLVELLTTLEEEYHIVITDEKAANITKVGELVAFLETILKK